MNNEGKVLLYGVYSETWKTTTTTEGGYSKTEKARDLLATFDTEELAAEYAKASLLKNPTNHHRFRMKSELAGYENYEIVTPEHSCVEHNPVL